MSPGLVAFVLPALLATHQGASRIAVSVVDAATGAPVAGAEVGVLARERAVRAWQAEVPATETGAWERARELWAEWKKTTGDGRAELERPNGALSIAARAPGLWAEQWVLDAAAREIELRLERDRTLSVEVVDASGAPASGLHVAIAQKPRARPGMPDIGFVATSAVVVSGEDGVARFRHFQRHLPAQSDASLRLVVELAIPLAEPVEIELDPSADYDAPLRLTLPPCGRVEVVVPGVARGSARLRKAPAGDSRGGRMWSNYAPPRVAIVDGRARFPFVGVGVELEVEASGPDLGQPMRERAAGPRAPGATSEHRFPGQETLPVIVGRLLDEELRPIADAPVGLTIDIQTGSGGESKGHSLRTDSSGGFRFVLSDSAPPAGTHRLLEFIGPAVDATDARSLDARPVAFVDLTRELAPGEHDLGDIELAVPGSDARLRRMSDDELAAEHDRIRELLERNAAHERELETCLTEMVRRGSERWIAFLQTELDALRARERADEWRMNEPPELVLLTALRRAQRRPDPLAIDIVTEGPTETTFPDLPILELRLTNVDRDEAFWLTTAHAWQFRADVRSSDGSAVAPLELWYEVGGASESPRLAFGQSERTEVDLAWNVVLPRPADYSVRVQYHPGDEIAFEPDVGGWILATSEPIVVRLRPLHVKLTRAELDRARAWIDSIEVSRPPLLVEQRWTPEFRLTPGAHRTEDLLFESGPKALPALLEALDEPDLDPLRRAWVLALLWDITGVHRTNTWDVDTALGVRDWVPEWPKDGARSGAGEAKLEAIGLSEQRVLADRWRSIRSCVEVEIVD